MRRITLGLGLAFLLAGAPPAAAQSNAPALARGSADVVALERGTSVVSFRSGRTLDVAVRYRRRGSTRSPLTLAARFGTGGKRCSRSPSSADRRRLRAAVRQGTSTTYVARGTARFPSGSTRICVWAKEGSGSYRRPKQLIRRFTSRMFAAVGAESTEDGFVIQDGKAASTATITGTRIKDSSAGASGGCTAETDPISSREIAGIHMAGIYSASTSCARVLQGFRSAHGNADITLGPTALGVPLRVTQHVGDCFTDPAGDLVVPEAAVRTFLPALGCRVGRVIRGSDPDRRRRGAPATGAAFTVLHRGFPVYLAPKDTVVDVVIDAS